MDWWTEGTLKSLLLPSGVVLLAAVVLFNGAFLTIPASIADLYYYAVFAMGVLLAWRFHSGRTLFGLITLLLAERGLQFFSGGHVPLTGSGKIAFDVLTFLLPLNLLWLGRGRERGLAASAVAPRLLAIFLQSVLVTVLCRPGRTSSPGILTNGWLGPGWFHWTHIPQLSLLAFAVAGGLLLLSFLRNRKSIEGGFLWSVAGVFLSFQSGGVGAIPTAHMATAGLFLLIAVVENSYSMAYQDELTGLPARRAFNEALLTLENRYAVAVVDIDHFKQFNDTYGHDTGDAVLCMVAARLARVTGGGTAYRCGGEEFAVLFPEKSVKDVLEHLESLRLTIERSSFQVRGQERRLSPRPEPDRRRISQKKRSLRGPVRVPAESDRLSVTVSIGVAESSARYREVNQVIAAADKALYRAKAAGRNRVEIAGARRSAGLRSAKAGTA